MSRPIFTTILFFVIIYTLPFACLAVVDTTEIRPMAVLVQLRSEHNRIAAMTKDRMYEEAKKVSADAIAVKNAMIVDFRDNFDLCPVYYYMDTNAALVLKKQFDGILFRADGSPAKNITIDSTASNYYIAYYGYPIEQPKLDETVKDKDLYFVNEDAPFGKGLVILDDSFKQVTYFYKLGYDQLFISHKIDHKYYFFSKHYDMEYYPFAGLFNKRKLNRYGNHRFPEDPKLIPHKEKELKNDDK